jgi:DivIVA domain-containing protein
MTQLNPHFRIHQARDIREKSFTKKTIGGLKPEEVSHFLDSLAEEWSELNRRNQTLEERLEASERELEKLRSLEASLLVALHDAKRAKEEQIEKAKDEAQLIMANSNARARALLDEAKLKAMQMLQESDQVSREKITAMQMKLKAMENQCQQVEQQARRIIGECHDFVRVTQERLARLSVQPIPLPDFSSTTFNIPTTDNSPVFNIHQPPKKPNPQTKTNPSPQPTKSTPYPNSTDIKNMYSEKQEVTGDPTTLYERILKNQQQKSKPGNP